MKESKPKYFISDSIPVDTKNLKKGEGSKESYEKTLKKMILLIKASKALNKEALKRNASFAE